jgi:hypothetical protein
MKPRGSGGNVVLSLFPAQIRQSYSPLGLKRTFSLSGFRENFFSFSRKKLSKSYGNYERFRENFRKKSLQTRKRWRKMKILRKQQT